MLSGSGHRVALGAALLVGSGFAASAQAASVLSLDINSVTAQSQDAAGNTVAFSGLTHTGKVVLSKGSTGFVSAIEVDGVNQMGSFGGELDSVTGEIVLNNGVVTGGTITLTVSPYDDTDTYTFTLTPDAQSKVVQVGSGFLLSSPTSGGAFDDNAFGGIDVSAFGGSALEGLFVQFNFQPDASGADANVDMELQINPAGGPGPEPGVVPVPAAAWLGLALMGGLGAQRLIRRRGK
jgi:hypothetical protein